MSKERLFLSEHEAIYGDSSDQPAIVFIFSDVVIICRELKPHICNNSKQLYANRNLKFIVQIPLARLWIQRVEKPRSTHRRLNLIDIAPEAGRIHIHKLFIPLQSNDIEFPLSQQIRNQAALNAVFDMRMECIRCARQLDCAADDMGQAMCESNGVDKRSSTWFNRYKKSWKIEHKHLHGIDWRTVSPSSPFVAPVKAK